MWQLRAIHVELDQAVMEAYGWDDVRWIMASTPTGRCERWTVSPAARVEILDRLLEENHRRAALQGGAGPADDEDEDDEPTSDTPAPIGHRRRGRRTGSRYEPDGRSWTARENLTDILSRELLGPADGAEEVSTAPPDTATWSAGSPRSG